MKKMNYVECLKTIDIARLKDIYNQTINEKKKKNDKQILNELKDMMLQQFPLNSLIMSKEEEKQIENILNDKEVKNISSNLLDLFIVFEINNEYVIPTEIVDVINNMKKSGMQIHKHATIVSFYMEINGVLHIDKLQNITNMSGYPLTKKEIKDVIKINKYLFENDYIYINEFVKDEELYKYKDESDYKIFNLQEMVEEMLNPEKMMLLEKMDNILEKYFEMHWQMTELIKSFISFGFNYEELIENILDEMEIKLSKKDEKEFYLLIDDLHDILPSWELNGYCPSEYYIKDDYDDFDDDFDDDFEEEFNGKFFEEYTEEDYVQVYLSMNGVMKIDTLLGLLNDEHNFDINKKKLKEVVKSIEFLDMNDEVIYIKALDDELIQFLLTSKSMLKKYKVIDDIEEFMCDDIDNYENIEETCGKYELDGDVIEELRDTMEVGLLNDETFNMSIKGNKLSSKDKEKLYKELKEINKNMRLWIYNGFKINELTSKNENKIGRNEKCKCGSGKKYKNCCGK